ncbi:unnamed protein product [marine sediment metagenome]|uniref:Uncharacterized protein n=1 Tax=marine sediment metagenome TaxID=412755 RepID=X1R8A2_9ZZZZ
MSEKHQIIITCDNCPVTFESKAAAFQTARREARNYGWYIGSEYKGVKSDFFCPECRKKRVKK